MKLKAFEAALFISGPRAPLKDDEVEVEKGLGAELGAALAGLLPNPKLNFGPAVAIIAEAEAG